MTSDLRASFWERYWFGEASLVRLAALRIILLAATLFGVLRFTTGVLQGADGADFAFLSNPWRPIYAFEMLHIGPMGPELARVVLVVLLVGLAFGILGLFTRTACALVAVLTFAQTEVGGWSGLMQLEAALPAVDQKMHLYLPSTHKDLPWTGVLTGLMALHFFYWGTNQFIVQRTLAAWPANAHPMH